MQISTYFSFFLFFTTLIQKYRISLRREMKLGKQQIFLFGVVVFSLIIRLLFFYIYLSDNPCQLWYDSGHYHAIAQQLLAGNGFGGQLYRLPGYPIFLACGYWLFDNSVTLTLLLQILFSLTIPILIFFLARKMLPKNPTVAFFAADIAALHPGLLIFSGLVMTETIFMIFFLLFLCCFWSNKQWYHWVLAGIMLGLVTLIRPVGHYVLATALLLIVVFPNPFKQKFKYMFWFAGSWLVTIAPWLIRNWLLTGALVLHTLGGAHFINHLGIRIVMQRDNISYNQARGQVYETIKQRAQGAGEVERSSVAERLVQEYVLQNPLITISLALKNMLKTCFSLYSSELLLIDSKGQMPHYQDNRTFVDLIKRFICPDVTSKKITFFIYYEILFFILLLIVFFGWLTTALLDPGQWWLLFAVLAFIGTFIVISSVCGFARLRLPVAPFLIIFASKFFIEMLQTKKVREWESQKNKQSS
jgi:4-amino-4-deoxy-L-arabinose transferase-like glycosyltransferase